MIELQITTAHNHCDAFSVPVRRVASGAAPRFLAAGAVGAVSEPRAAAAAGGGLSTVAGAAELSFCAAFHARCALFHVVGAPHADHASSNGVPRSAIFSALSKSEFDVLPMMVRHDAALRQPRAKPEHTREQGAFCRIAKLWRAPRGSRARPTHGGHGRGCEGRRQSRRKCELSARPGRQRGSALFCAEIVQHLRWCVRPRSREAARHLS